jgi:hypothetical protein
MLLEIAMAAFMRVWILSIVFASTSGALAAEPLRILFIGNSYTYTYDIPGVVHSLAVDAGLPEPLYATLAQPSWFLSTHRANPETVNLIDNFELDVVVLQEQSLRPTNPFNPGQFKADAAWFYDRIKARSPKARIILYETWARAPGDTVYPGTFFNPAIMQSQLRTHYTDAALSYIPAHSTAASKTDASVAPVGDAWERELGTYGIGLHDADLSHPNFDGAYLSALVLFSSIYHTQTRGLDPLGRDPATAAKLQAVADSMVPEPGGGVAVLAVMVAVLARRRVGGGGVAIFRSVPGP